MKTPSVSRKETLRWQMACSASSSVEAGATRVASGAVLLWPVPELSRAEMASGTKYQAVRLRAVAMEFGTALMRWARAVGSTSVSPQVV